MVRVNVLLTILILTLYSCKEKSVFEKISETNILLSTPKPGEWLAEHKETGQTFEQYSKLDPLKPNMQRNKIYILPIGGFTRQEDSIVNATVEYLNFFYNTEVIKMEGIKDDMIPDDMRRLNENGDEQLNADYLIKEIIPNFKPKDGLVIMGITGRDLYPKPSWNYVFGLATYNNGIGVSSIARYEPNNKNFALGLGRTIKTSAHEIGHMFKMKHCTYANCVMNGVNSLGEADRKPNLLCSECLKKMQHNFGFNLKERFNKILDFYHKYSLVDDEKLILKQLEAIQ